MVMDSVCGIVSLLVLSWLMMARICRAQCQNGTRLVSNLNLTIPDEFIPILNISLCNKTTNVTKCELTKYSNTTDPDNSNVVTTYLCKLLDGKSEKFSATRNCSCTKSNDTTLTVRLEPHGFTKTDAGLWKVSINNKTSSDHVTIQLKTKTCHGTFFKEPPSPNGTETVKLFAKSFSVPLCSKNQSSHITSCRLTKFSNATHPELSDSTKSFLCHSSDCNKKCTRSKQSCCSWTLDAEPRLTISFGPEGFTVDDVGLWRVEINDRTNSEHLNFSLQVHDEDMWQHEYAIGIVTIALPSAMVIAVAIFACCKFQHRKYNPMVSEYQKKTLTGVAGMYTRQKSKA